MPEIQRVVMIAASPRTGSNLLCTALSTTGKVGAPTEYLQPALLMVDHHGLGPVDLSVRGRAGQLKRRLQRDPRWRNTGAERFTRRGVERTLEEIARRYTAPSGVLGIKVMWDTYSRVMLRHGFDADVWGAPVTWVRIRRNDSVAQAVSWSRAIQTQQWTADDESQAEPQYDPDDIEWRMQSAASETAGWDTYFSQLGISPFTVTYEDLDGRYEQTVSSVLEHLGVRDVDIPAPPLRRQADQRNIEWAKQFVAERLSDPHA